VPKKGEKPEFLNPQSSQNSWSTLLATVLEGCLCTSTMVPQKKSEILYDNSTAHARHYFSHVITVTRVTDSDSAGLIPTGWHDYTGTARVGWPTCQKPRLSEKKKEKSLIFHFRLINYACLNLGPVFRTALKTPKCIRDKSPAYKKNYNSAHYFFLFSGGRGKITTYQREYNLDKIFNLE
jgi:hypothetical protein